MDAPSKMSIGEWIRKERGARGLSQANLARLLDVAQPQLSQWETQRVVPSGAKVAQIRETLNQFDRDLANGTLPPTIRPRSRGRIARSHNGTAEPSKTSSVDADCQDAAHRIARLKRLANSPEESIRTAKRFKGIALFAGCGGMSLGFKRAGFDVRGFVELEQSARAIYEKNFADAICLGTDIRAITNDEVIEWKKIFGNIDVLFGGPPCQGFSLAGKRNVFDPRNQLFQNFAQIATVLQPSIVVLENVRLLTSMKAPDGLNGFPAHRACVRRCRLSVRV